MRRRARTLTLLTAAAALLAGCTTEVAGNAAPADEQPVLSDDERHETFCTDVPALLSDISEQLDDVQSDPTSAVAALDDAVERMEQVQPPDDAEDEWERLVAVWRDLRDLLGRADLENPSANTELAPELLELQPELVAAGTAVDRWGQSNC